MIIKGELECYRFFELEEGEVFAFSSGLNNIEGKPRLYLKCAKTADGKHSAVNLRDGNIVIVDCQTEVIRVNGEFVIKK